MPSTPTTAATWAVAEKPANPAFGEPAGPALDIFGDPLAAPGSPTGGLYASVRLACSDEAALKAQARERWDKLAAAFAETTAGLAEVGRLQGLRRQYADLARERGRLDALADELAAKKKGLQYATPVPAGQLVKLDGEIAAARSRVGAIAGELAQLDPLVAVARKDALQVVTRMANAAAQKAAAEARQQAEGLKAKPDWLARLDQIAVAVLFQVMIPNRANELSRRALAGLLDD